MTDRPDIALVTRASRGIGRAAAIALAAAGAHGVGWRARRAASRNSTTDSRPPAAARARRLRSDGSARLAAIDRLGEALYRAGAGLTLCSATPAAGLLTPLPTSTRRRGMTSCGQRHRQLAPHPSLDPLLRRSAAAGCVPNLRGGEPGGIPAYWAPMRFKRRLDALARTYAAETLNTSTSASCSSNPGPLRTRCRRNGMPGEDPERCAPRTSSGKNRRDLLARLGRNGKLYDFPSDRILQFHAPADQPTRRQDWPCGFSGRLYKKAASLRPAGG